MRLQERAGARSGDDLKVMLRVVLGLILGSTGNHGWILSSAITGLVCILTLLDGERIMVSRNPRRPVKRFSQSSKR